MPNLHLSFRLSAVWATTAKMGCDDEDMSTTQLDSHANMVIIGHQATVLEHTGKCTDVRPFSNDCSKLESVPIVDAAVAYDCPYSMETYILAIKNALHVPSMEHNLIPPFILRGTTLRVLEESTQHYGTHKVLAGSVVEGCVSLTCRQTITGVQSFVTRLVGKESTSVENRYRNRSNI